MLKRRGLTLTELMVVILIIAFLATVAMAVVKNARTKSRDTKRVYDIQQYAKAVRLYAHENQGNFPPDNGYVGRGDSIDTALAPFLPGLPADPSDKDGTTANDYYYYYVAANVCNGEVVPTIHFQNAETGAQDVNRNDCTDGLGGSENGFANSADYLVIIN